MVRRIALLLLLICVVPRTAAADVIMDLSTAQITIDRLCKAGTRYIEIRADCESASLRASHGGRATVQLGRKRAEKTGIRLDFGAGGIAWVERGLSRKTIARNPMKLPSPMLHGTIR